MEITEDNLGDLPNTYIGEKYDQITEYHPYKRLPREFIGLSNTHQGGFFLVCDFVDGLIQDKLPPNHVWAAARYNAPGIVAHESAKREGERMAIPDFGKPPEHLELLDPDSWLRD